MAEEANDVQTQAVETQETTTPTPSVEETKAPEVAKDDIMDALGDEETKKKSDTEVTEEAKPEEKPIEELSKEESEEQPTEEQPRGKKDANQRIRQLVSEKRQLEQQVAELNAKVYKPQTAEELQQEGMDETKAMVESMRQEQEVREFNRQVTELNNVLETEAAQVLEDFPIFDESSNEYKADNGATAQMVKNLYERTIQRDPRTGLVIQAQFTPYEFYKAFADVRSEAAQRGEQNGQVAGQRATAQMLASAEPSTSSAPREKKDPIMEALTSSD